jgi:hypothetical protein
MDGSALASLVSSSSIVASNGVRAIAGLNEFFQLLNVSLEKSLVIDHDSRAPAVMLALITESDRKAEEEYESQRSNGKRTSLPSTMTSNHHHVVGHMNYEYWLSVLADNIPKFVTICTRTSKISAEFLNFTQIRDIIQSKVQLKADKAAVAASNRRRSSTTFKSKKSKGTVMKALFDIRRFGFKEGTMEELAGGRMKMELEPFEIVFVKTNDPPFPMITFDMLGLKISVPIDDDTLCHALAMFLAKAFPMFV